MGKTVTTELAVYTPGPTRNPRNLEHTPGGSSQGSVAAVAAYMAPLAIGTQTNGSVVRPASFCGVFGFKPTFGLISRTNTLMQSPPLDTIGVFARSIEDLAIATGVLSGYDERDRDMRPGSRAAFAAAAMARPAATPAFVFIQTPVWAEAEPVTQEAFTGLARRLGTHCEATALPDIFSNAVDWQRVIHTADVAKNYAPFYESGGDRLSARLRGMIEEGQRVTAVEYNRAREHQDILNGQLDRVFDRYDAIITPASTGPAPRGLASTGNPIFCSMWTYLGVPAISLPLLEADGLPLGVQLIGRRGDDARLLRTANWLTEFLSASPN